MENAPLDRDFVVEMSLDVVSDVPLDTPVPEEVPAEAPAETELDSEASSLEPEISGSTGQANEDMSEAEEEETESIDEELPEEEINKDVSGAEEEETESIDEEPPEEEISVSAPLLLPDQPFAVYLVDDPAEGQEEVDLYAVTGSPYPGMISATYLDYFAGIADKLGYGEHYMVFRSSQYNYYMVWGDDLTYDGYRFRGSALSYCRIYTGSSSSNMSITYGSDTFDLTPGTGSVYSDLDYFPSLTRGGTHVEFFTILFAIGFAVVYSVCHDLFDYVMEHVYRK